MGFYLLHESMLDAVIFARDKFLKDDKLSIMLPSHATIYSAPCSLEHYLIEKVRIRFIELAHVRNTIVPSTKEATHDFIYNCR